MDTEFGEELEYDGQKATPRVITPRYGSTSQRKNGTSVCPLVTVRWGEWSMAV